MRGGRSVSESLGLAESLALRAFPSCHLHVMAPRPGEMAGGLGLWAYLGRSIRTNHHNLCQVRWRQASASKSISTLQETQERRERQAPMCTNLECIGHIPICEKYLRKTLKKTTNESSGDLGTQEDEVTFKSCCFNDEGAISLGGQVCPARRALPQAFTGPASRPRPCACFHCFRALWVPFLRCCPLFCCSLTLVGSSPCSCCFSPAQLRRSIALLYLRNALKYGAPSPHAFHSLKNTHFSTVI